MNLNKQEKIIIAIIAVVAIIAIVYLVFFYSEEEIQYYLTTSSLKSSNLFIEDYETFDKFIEDSGAKQTLTNQNDFSKTSISQVFNEAYFADKKVAVVVTYEDTTKNYIKSVDELVYNDDKTQLTIKYTDKHDGYADVLSDIWYNYMFVEIDGTVKDVTFEKQMNSSSEADTK